MAVRPVAVKKQQSALDNERHLFDTHPEVRLDFSHVREALNQGYAKPFLLVDTNIVRIKARRFKAAMPRVQPHYAVKANPDPRVLKTLVEEGVGFEIASIAELDLLLGLGLPAAEVYYSNPMKSRAYLEYAAAKGVEWYVLDSVEELRYDIITDRSGKAIPWCIAGPTCDSVDVCMRDEMFPEDMEEGDFIYIANAGAYTTAYASNFNGFPLPEVRVI